MGTFSESLSHYGHNHRGLFLGSVQGQTSRAFPCALTLQQQRKCGVYQRGGTRRRHSKWRKGLATTRSAERGASGYSHAGILFGRGRRQTGVEA